MVGPIWGSNIQMGKPQSKMEIQENIVNHGDAKNEKMIPEYATTLLIVGLILLIAYKINKYIKKYVHKHNQNITHV